MVEAMTSDESREGVEAFLRSASQIGAELVLIETDEVWLIYLEPCAMLRWWVPAISRPAELSGLKVSS